MKKRLVLVVLDGWGYREETKYNAIAQANTPFLDRLMAEYPYSLLAASGSAVGLPEGEMGNSEIGHLSIGAGKVLENDLVRINNAVKNNGLDENKALQTLCHHIQEHNSTLHIQGLLSPGGIHSHEEHLFGILRFLKKIGLKKVVLHIFTDGRDTAPQSAAESLRTLEKLLDELQIGVIATASGRYFAMDRDHNWERVEKTEKAIFHGEGNRVQGKKPSEHFEDLYKQGVWDEHVEPIVFLEDSGECYTVKENDGILFFNFRADRARMLSKKIVDRSKLHNLCFVSLTEYDAALECIVAFPPLFPDTTLAAELSQHGLKQVHIAETEKYAHATYFLNGKKETPHDGEEFLLIESRKDVPTHDLAPEMRAKEIVDAAIATMQQDVDFIFLNLANADMVGHTADWDATLIAIESIDREMKRLVEAAQEHHMVVMITADHGNAEKLFDEDGQSKHTAHTNNPVPCIFTQKGFTLDQGSLIDVAPTILEWYGIAKPPSMTGENLLKRDA